MTKPHSNQWAEVSPYLDEALELDPQQREPWLATLGSTQPLLAAELRELLALHAANRASGFLERSPLRNEESLAGEQIGPYTIERLLGRGGMGSVWLARRSDGKFEGSVAIKLLDRRGLGRDAAEHIRHEASLLARLSHPHIARLYDAGVRDNGQPYLILEYVAGERIDRYCATRELPLPARLRLFLGVLDAVAHAHAQLIVHLDLKPSNVLVTPPDGVVKLLDFGVAALQLLRESQLRPPAEGAQALTPGYAAPEQIRGEPVSTAADVYALGVLLHVLITGVHPFGTPDSTFTQLARATLTGESVPASGRLSDAAERRRARGDLDAIIARALEADPARRYASATEFAADIRAFLGNFPVQARRATRTYVAHKFAQRHWGGVLSVLLTLLVLLGAGLMTTLQMLEATRQRDFARAQLGRAAAINDLNYYVINDAGPAGKPITARGLLARAEHVLQRQQLNDSNRVTLLTSIGWEYEAQGDHASGLRILNDAYRLSREVSDPAARAEAACALANALANEGHSPRSNELIEAGLRELPDSAEFALDRASCLSRGNQVARNLGDPQLAIQRSEAAIEALKTVPFAHDVAEMHAYEELAASLGDAGRYREANMAFASGWPRLVALGRDDTIGAGTWLNNWAVTLLKMGRPLEAERLLRRAGHLEETGSPGDAPSPMRLSNYALALLELARADEAAGFAERAYEGALQEANPIVINQARLRLARVYRAQHKPERSLQVLDEAQVAMAKLLPPGHFALGSLAAERALTLQARGDFPAALKSITEAVQIDTTAAQSGKAGAQYLPVLLTYRAGIEFDEQQLAAAEADAQQALKQLLADAQPGDYSSNVGRAELTLARVLHAEGKPADSRSAAQEAAQQLEKALGPDHPETQAARELGLLPQAPST